MKIKVIKFLLQCIKMCYIWDKEVKIKRSFNSGPLSRTRQTRLMNGWVIRFCSSLFCVRLRLAGNKNHVPVGLCQCSKTCHNKWQIHSKFKSAQQSVIKETPLFLQAYSRHSENRRFLVCLKWASLGHIKATGMFLQPYVKANILRLASQVILCGSHWFNTCFTEGKTHKSKWWRTI